MIYMYLSCHDTHTNIYHYELKLYAEVLDLRIYTILFITNSKYNYKLTSMSLCQKVAVIYYMI